MWIFMNNSFLSIVAHRDEPRLLLVRARREADITAVFPGVGVAQDPFADYPYRAFLPRKTVAKAIEKQVSSISYDNFKDSVPGDDPARYTTYSSIWATLMNLELDPPE